MLKSLRYLLLLAISPALAAPTYVTSVGGWQGSPPAASASFTPGVSSVAILSANLVTAPSFAATYSGTGGGTWTSTNDTSGAFNGDSVGAGNSNANAATAQTVTVNTSAGFIQDVGALVYSGVTTIGTPVLTANNAPGASISGATVSVASGSLLVVIFADLDNTGATITPTAGTSRGSGFTFSGVASEYAGAGSNITPAATVSASADHYAVYQWVLSGSGATCSNLGWNKATGNWSIPNGSSGSFWGKSGGSVIPDCSSVSYFQKSGVFGTN